MATAPSRMTFAAATSPAQRAPFLGRGGWGLSLGLLLLAAAALPWRGYSFGNSNHSVQVPLVQMYLDGSLFRFDLLRTSFEGYTSFFFPILAGLTKLTGNLQATYFAVYLVTQVAALAAIYRLSLELFDHPPSALLACLLYLAQIQSPSAETTHDSRLTHGELVTALLLWSLLLHFRRRPKAAFLLCGLAFNLHALYAAYVAALMAADALFRGRGRRDALPPLLAGLGLFLLMALPGLAWMARDAAAHRISSMPDWLAVMRERSTFHAFPLSIPAATYARYLLLLALGALALQAAPGGEWRRTILHFAVAAGVLCVIGLVFSEWWPSSLVIRAQLVRSTKWLLLVLIVPIGRLLTASWEWGVAGRVAAALATLGLLVREPAWLSLGLLVYLLFFASRWTVMVTALAGFSLAVSALTHAAPLAEKLGLNAIGRDLRPLVLNPTTVACLALLAVLAAATQRLRARQLHVVQATAALLALFIVLPAFYRERRAATQADGWVAVQAWAEQNTPKDAVFLTPPYREGFRVFSRRAVVGEWKDGTQQFFSPEFAFEWHRRMSALGGAGAGYDDLDAARLLALGREFGASYAVVRADRPLALPALFANDDYTVYRL